LGIPPPILILVTVIGCGSLLGNAWIGGPGNDLDVVAHEVAHAVEFAYKGINGSPQLGV